MGGGGKTPSLPATPNPQPVPQPTAVNPTATESQRVMKVTQLKQGMMSTIKTNPGGLSRKSTIKTTPQGVMGVESDFNVANPTGRKTLGGQ